MSEPDAKPWFLTVAVSSDALQAWYAWRDRALKSGVEETGHAARLKRAIAVNAVWRVMTLPVW